MKNEVGSCTLIEFYGGLLRPNVYVMLSTERGSMVDLHDPVIFIQCYLCFPNRQLLWWV